MSTISICPSLLSTLILLVKNLTSFTPLPSCLMSTMSICPGVLNPGGVLVGSQDGQRLLSGMLQCIRRRRNIQLYDSPRLLHPWQMGQALSDRVSSDLSNHYNQLLPSPPGWDISKRNAQVLIYDPEGHAIGLDSAHYEMLAEFHGPTSAPTDLFLRVVLLSCMRQRTADVDYYLPWNHYLLTCLRYVLEAACLVGERAVTFNPHFPYFLSPDSSDSVLGSLLCWSSESALLLLDSFMPLLREATIQQACEQTHEVWILRQDRPPHYAAADLQLIRGKFARLVAVIPLISLVLHSPSCWLVRRETG